jgi:hypothetical protein
MGPRSGFVRCRAAVAAAAMLALLVSCAASVAEVRQANAARYPEAAFEEVFRSTREALVAKGYTVGNEDFEHGLVVSNWISVRYQDDKSRDRYRQEVAFMVAVELRRQGDGTLTVVVDGTAGGWSRDAADRPAFVDGRRDAVAAEIYRRIGHLSIKPRP